MGATEGALVGKLLGCGVGAPRVYVGRSVGFKVGALEGEAVGSGVGLAVPDFLRMMIPSSTESS